VNGQTSDEGRGEAHSGGRKPSSAAEGAFDGRGADPEDLGVSAAILRRRQIAARVRRRRLLAGDAAIALAIVLMLLIFGIGVGMLGVIAVLILIGLGLALAVAARPRRRRRRRG
jgi:hypothetical protein